MADEKSDVAGSLGWFVATEAPEVLPGYELGRCWQHQASVDKLARRVVCAKCKAELDPFDVLSQIAHANASKQYATDELRNLRESVAALKAEEKRVKARLKNTMRKDADAAVEAERARSLESRRRCVWKAKEALRLVEEIKQALGREFDDG